MNRKEIVKKMETAMASGGNVEQYLNFSLKDEVYGIEITRVKEILEFKGCTRMPMVPEFIRGVINLRGHVVPVLDLQKFFFGNDSQITKWSCVIILEQDGEGENMYTGILVDSVRQVMEIQESNLEEPPDFGTPIAADYIHALGKVEDELVIILSLDKLLSYRDAEAVKQAANAALIES